MGLARTRAPGLRANERQQRFDALLRELVAEDGFLGAALVSRDGIRVTDVWAKEAWNKETFSAMSATLMGAAEIALAEVGGARARRVIAETTKSKMCVVGASDELVLVALARADVGLERFLPLVETAAERAGHIVQG